jgi:hypothetical protein
VFGVFVQLTVGTVHDAFAFVNEEPVTAYPLQFVLSETVMLPSTRTGAPG